MKDTNHAVASIYFILRSVVVTGAVIATDNDCTRDVHIKITPGHSLGCTQRVICNLAIFVHCWALRGPLSTGYSRSLTRLGVSGLLLGFFITRRFSSLRQRREHNDNRIKHACALHLLHRRLLFSRKYVSAKMSTSFVTTLVRVVSVVLCHQGCCTLASAHPKD